jgi:hypothetical protein
MREAENQMFENMEVRLIHVGSGALKKKMLKMKDEPTMCMKTQAKMTKCIPKEQPFYSETHRLTDNLRESVGLFG